jgi:hypothetical protein
MMREKSVKSIALIVLSACLLSSCASPPEKVSTPVTNYPTGWIVKAQTELTEGMFAYVSLRNMESELLKHRQEECEKMGREVEIDGDLSLVSQGTRYWLYRNKTDTLVFSVEYSVETGKNLCIASIQEKRYVETYRTNSNWPFPFSKGRVRWNDPYSTSNTEIKGVQARCREVNIVGLSGYGECFSVNKDLTKGMMLRKFAWTDELDNPAFNGELNIEIVIPHALIDANIFTLSEAWAHKTN